MHLCLANRNDMHLHDCLNMSPARVAECVVSI